MEWEKGKLTSKEALRNLGEIIDASELEEDRDHYWEVIEKIITKEAPAGSNSDTELDKSWHDENH